MYVYSLLSFIFSSEVEDLLKKVIWCWEQNQNLSSVLAQDGVWLTLNWVVPHDGQKQLLGR